MHLTGGILVKSLSGRRSKQDRPVSLLWIGVYGLLALICVYKFVRLGFSYLLWLGLPGMAVFIWHLWLVSQRRERRQMGVDILGACVLALAAPAAFWIGRNGSDPLGWWLWILTWLQSAASIMYAFLRLFQRTLKETPPLAIRWQMGRRALLYSGFNLGLSAVAGLLGWLPGWLWLAYLVQFTEVLWGTLNPAIGVKPTAIGFRQLAVSSLFTFAFILTWQIF